VRVGQGAGFDIRFALGEEPVVLTQASALPQIGGAALVQAKEALHLTPNKQTSVTGTFAEESDGRFKFPGRSDPPLGCLRFLL
jgi:hypothetical protein